MSGLICLSCSLFMSLILYLLLPPLSSFLELLSVISQPFWLFFWALFLWNALCFLLVFFAKQRWILTLFSVLCSICFSTSFFLTTSGTSLLSINTCNSLSISFFSEMALGYGHNLCTALGTKSDWLHANLIISYQKDTKPLTQDLTEYFSNEQCFLIKEVFEIYVHGSFIFWPKDLNFDSFTIK